MGEINENEQKPCGAEGPAHIRLKDLVKNLFKDMGLKVEMEEDQTLDSFVDGIAEYQGLKIGIEVGVCRVEKLFELANKFDMVAYFPYAIPHFGYIFNAAHDIPNIMSKTTEELRRNKMKILKLAEDNEVLRRQNLKLIRVMEKLKDSIKNIDDYEYMMSEIHD
jgi:hypothetical protein